MQYGAAFDKRCKSPYGIMKDDLNNQETALTTHRAVGRSSKEVLLRNLLRAKNNNGEVVEGNWEKSWPLGTQLQDPARCSIGNGCMTSRVINYIAQYVGMGVCPDKTVLSVINVVQKRLTRKKENDKQLRTTC